MKRSESSVSLLTITILLYFATVTGFQTRTALANYPGEIVKAGEVTAKMYDLNPVTRYEYDDNGNLRHQYDPRDLHTEFVYDELNRKKEHIQPDGPATTYKYDEEGNIKSTTDPNKNTVTYDYDELNRETDVYYREDPDSPFVSTVSIHTDYDGNNNVTMITETEKEINK